MDINPTIPVDNKKLEEFVIRAVGDIGSSLVAMMIITGERLGLYKALSKYGPLSSKELAEKQVLLKDTLENSYQ